MALKHSLKCSLKYKIWLDSEGKIFGAGPCQLLQAVAETGSLVSAARTMHMSYSQAYNLIKGLERRLGFALITSRTGGSGGGGSELTPEARELMATYRSFSDECHQALNSIFEKYFGEFGV